MNIDPYFKNRLTIRKYSDKEVSDSDLQAMLESAIHAPNTGNMQLYSIIVTRDPEILSRLRPAHFNQPASQAPVLITFCADVNRFEKWSNLNNAKAGFRNLQMLTCAIIDASLVAQQFVTIAEQNGFGTCYLGTTTYNAPQIAEVLNLPSGVVPVTTVSIGRPAESGTDSGRLPLEAVLHKEEYADYSDDKIMEIYREKEAREDSKAFVAENDKETLAQVFTDIRYPRDMNETFSEVFRNYLKKNGFDVF